MGESGARKGSIGPVARVTEVRMRGQAEVAIMPPRPCAFGDCVAEVVITLRGVQARVHVNDQGRQDIISGLVSVGREG
jgi:hypothetical protein